MYVKFNTTIQQNTCLRDECFAEWDGTADHVCLKLLWSRQRSPLLSNGALPKLHRAAPCFCDQPPGVPWFIAGWNKPGYNSSIASATLAGDSQSNWWVKFLKRIEYNGFILKISLLSVVWVNRPNYMYCLDMYQSFVMKLYLFFLSFTVYPDTCLVLSQLLEPGQLFFFRA